jgi:hypothetical protein
VEIAERSVTVLLHRYEERVALRMADTAPLRERLRRQGGVILALAGLQPDVGHEVRWVLRAVVSGAPLLARSLLGATADDLVALREEVQTILTGQRPEEAIPIRGVISDGQVCSRHAVARVFPGVPHQLCQVPYLREAAKPIFAADRHAKKELKKRVRGGRPSERSLEGPDGQSHAQDGQSHAQAAAARSGPQRLPGGAQRPDRRRAPPARRIRTQTQGAARGDCRLSRPGRTARARGAGRGSGFLAAGTEGTGGLSKPLARLLRLLRHGLETSAPLWPPIQTAYALIHHAAHLLANHDDLDAAGGWQG